MLSARAAARVDMVAAEPEPYLLQLRICALYLAGWYGPLVSVVGSVVARFVGALGAVPVAWYRVTLTAVLQLDLVCYCGCTKGQ